MLKKIKKLRMRLNGWAKSHPFDLAVSILLATILWNLNPQIQVWLVSLVDVYGGVEFWGAEHPVSLAVLSSIMPFALSIWFVSKRKV